MSCWLLAAVLAIAACIVVGIVALWVSDDDPAAHAERDAGRKP